MTAMIPDKVWDILEIQGIVPAPKLPEVSKVVQKAREKACSVQINYPADPDEFVFAIVTRQGTKFTGEAAKDVESVAIALADCLDQTEPVQLTLDDATDPVVEPPHEPAAPKTRKRVSKAEGVLADAEQHLASFDEDVIDAEMFDEDGEPTAPITQLVDLDE